MPDIMHSLKIDAPPETVFQAIATADGIRHWWTGDAALEPRLGGAGTFGFFGRRFVATVEIVTFGPLSTMTWRVSNAAWPGDTIEFDLVAQDRHTRLNFAHRGFAQADQRYASATTRWGFYLFSLKQYLETGKGMPNPNEPDF
ncbi:MAG: SRPBCC domain-containing protein [Rhodopseudomonas sp.]|nr:SRPBCC domain-containing protein [Rhodopseudomonas sp.]